VYVLSYDSLLYAVDAASGTPKWTFATGGERRFAAPHIHGLEPKAEPMPDPFDFYLSSPTVAGGLVYFGSGDGQIYAVEAATGALRWKVQTGNVVHASPTVVAGVVYVGSFDTYFYALDAATGQVKWRFKTGDDSAIHNQTGIQSSAAVADGLVYFGCRDSHLYALNVHDGQQAWAFDTHGSWVIGSPAVRGGTVYFATSDSALFHTVDARTGNEQFSVTFKWPMFSSPAVAGSYAYLGSHEGKLLAIDLTARQAAWTFQTEGSKRNGATFTNAQGAPSYGAAMSSLFYDDIVFGIKTMFTTGAILSSPVIAGDTIYVGSADGSLYAVY
jgi:outer membrane protein assembly factor BamB